MRPGTTCGWVRKRLFSVLLGLVGMAALAQDNAAAVGAPAAGVAGISDGVIELWKGMFDAGMIDDVQYQYVLQHGCLPRDSVVQNSPVPAAKQSAWQGLAAQKVITPEELAQMMFKGSIPNLSETETKAFEDLAPVYEPDRSKRLTYQIRRKHQRVEAIRLKHRASTKWKERYDEAVVRAQADDLPLRVESEDGRVAELFAYDHDRPLYNVTFSRISADTISTDEVRPGGTAPFGLTGTNVTVAMWDGGTVLTSHQEFATARVSLGDAGSLGDHATRVAGTMIASGIQSNAQGMAYQASVLSYEWNQLIPEMADCAISNEQVRVSNHSYGLLCGWDNVNWFYFVPRWWGDTRLSEDEDYQFGFYSDIPHDMDDFCYTAAYHLPVYSVGNDRDDRHFGGFLGAMYPLHGVRTWPGGTWNNSSLERPNDGLPAGFDCITPYGVAKNILTVGAVLDLPGGYTNGASVELDWYSGAGPTDDGRVKPDVVANGQELYSTTGDTNNVGYASASGTSFSSPSVAGSLLLLQELHERIYGTNAPMLSSTLKGLVIHTADDVGNVGPDYRYGWGLADTLAAAWVITNNAAWDSLPHIKEVSLADGQFVQFGALASTNEPLKVTICWTDPAGPVQDWALDPTNLILVNDLDLRVISPDGSQTNAPWILDPQNPTNGATTGDNFRDNVEQVVITAPTNGWYTIQVTHKGTLSNGVQDVSIIVTGNTPTNAPDFVITDIGAVGTNGWIGLEWPGVVGALYQIDTTTNLLVQDSWTNQNDAVSANLEQMQWADEDAAYDEIRFYRLKRVR